MRAPSLVTLLLFAPLPPVGSLKALKRWVTPEDATDTPRCPIRRVWPSPFETFRWINGVKVNLGPDCMPVARREWDEGTAPKESPAWAVRLRLRNVTEEPPVEVGGAVHVTTVCCHACMPLVTFLRSLTAQVRLEKHRKYVVHVFSDEKCFNVAERLAKLEPWTLAQADVRFYNVLTVPGAVWTDIAYSKPCMLVRLFLPRFFNRLKRLLYLDVDTLVVDRLTRIYDLRVPVFAMAENDPFFYGGNNSLHCPSVYGQNFYVKDQSGTNKCFIGRHGMNSGVMVWNLVGWREANLDAEVDSWVQNLASGALQSRLVDQDMFNIIGLKHPEYFVQLPCEANVRFVSRWMCFFGSGTWEAEEQREEEESGAAVLKRNSRNPIVLHSKFGYGAVAQEWLFFRGQAMQAAKLINQGQKNANSLCDAFNCGRMLAEERLTLECSRQWTCEWPQEPPFYVETLKPFHWY